MPLTTRTVRQILVSLALLTCAVVAPTSAQWQRVTGVGNSFYNEVFFISASTGWITSQGATILRTTNSGVTWTAGTLPGATISANRDICFIDASIGFVSGSDSVWKTTNGGATWTGIGPAGRRPGSAVAWFADANNGVVGVGDCLDTSITFYRTTNAGVSWDSVRYTSTTGTAVGGIAYQNGTYVAACEGGKLWRSTDGGANWTYSNTGSNGWQEDIIASNGNLFIASANGTACGTAGGGVVLRSANGGSTWLTTNFATTIMWGATMYSSTGGWSCGDNGKAFRTVDGGASWTELSCGMSSIDAVDDIFFYDSTNGWAVGTAIYKYVGDSARVVPDTVNFGDVIILSWKDSTAALKSLGGPSMVTSRAIVGRDSTSFLGTGGLGPQLVPSCLQLPTALRFAPTTEGIKTARLEYRVNGMASPLSVVLIGRGVRPRIYADSTMRFDTILCVDRVVDSIPIENRGTAPLKITTITFTGTSPNAFAYNGVLPLTIPPGITTYLVFRSVALGSGPLSATAILETNEPDAARSPWRVHLSGFSQGISFQFNRPNPIVIPGAPPAQFCITYRNTGNGPQRIESIIPLTNDTTIKLILPIGPTTIPVGDSAQICFEATATDTALHQRKFRVRTMPCFVDTVLTVMFRPAAPVVAGPDILALRSQCGADRIDSFTISNAGTAPLIVGAPVIGGADRSEFSFLKSITAPDTLAPGDSRQILIRFAPADPNRFTTRSADITIPTNDIYHPSGVLRITLTGTITIARVRTSTDTIDVGELCLGEWSQSFALPVHNDGTASAVALILSPDTAIHSFKGHLPERPIMAGATDTIHLEVHPNRVGPLIMPMTIRAGPCNLVDTVIIVGTVVGIQLAQPPSMSMGPVRVGSTGTGTVRLQNNGILPFTIDRLTMEPSGSEFTIVSPVPPVVIAAGASIDVTVSLTPADTGAYSGQMIVHVGGRCPYEDTTAITALGTSASVVPLRGSIDMGTLSACDPNDVRRDTVVLTNAGTGAVELQSVALTDGSYFTIESAPTTPRPILPGETVTIIVATTPALVGEGVDTLLCDVDQADIPRLAIPITASRHAAAATIKTEAGEKLTTIDFGSMLPCAPDTFIVSRIFNSGDVSDTFDLSLSGPAYNIVTQTQVVLDSGSSVQVVLVATSADAGAQEELVVVSRLCGREWRFPVASTSVSLASHLEIATSQPLPVGVSATLSTRVVSQADVPLRISNVGVLDPLAEFLPSMSYVGTIVQPGASVPINLTGVPFVTGTRSITVVVELDGGCPTYDTVEVPLEVVAPNVRRRIHISAGTTVERWGALARIPLALLNPEQGILDSATIHLHVNPTLLDVRGLVSGTSLSGQWRLDDVVFAAATGDVHATIRSVSDSARPVSSDTALILEALVLRGPEVESSVRVVADSSDHGAIVTTDSGRFVLADYCDAHGRRLATTGSFALEQNTPNPFNPTTEIEFETPFPGRVSLQIFDDRGVLVKALLDETLPAGRRRITFDAGELPSGTYICRMTIGLQSIVRRMTLVR